MLWDHDTLFIIGTCWTLLNPADWQFVNSIANYMTDIYVTARASVQVSVVFDTRIMRGHVTGQARMNTDRLLNWLLPLPFYLLSISVYVPAKHIGTCNRA
jgi:hypothetical protein